MTWAEASLAIGSIGVVTREALLFVRSRHAVSTVDARKLEERIWAGLQHEIRRLEEENAVLRRRDDEQEREIKELRAELNTSLSERAALRSRVAELENSTR